MNADIKDAVVVFFNPPPIMGLSTTGGFEVYVQDRTGGGVQSLAAAPAQLVAAAAARPQLAGVRTTFATSVLQYRIDLDRDMAEALGLPIDSVFATLQTTFCTPYVSDSSHA